MSLSLARILNETLVFLYIFQSFIYGTISEFLKFSISKKLKMTPKDLDQIFSRLDMNGKERKFSW